MKSHLRSLSVVVILAVCGGVCWSLGHAEKELASTARLLSMLRYADAGQQATNIGSIWRFAGISKIAARLHVIAAYWSGRYDLLLSDTDRTRAEADHDAEERLAVANAAYRHWQMQNSNSHGEASLQSLDDVIKEYAEAIKSNPNSEDAAYNYEFLLRARDAINANSKFPAKPAEPGTIHGQPGAPPKGSNMSQFKVIVPQRPDERKEDNQAGKSERMTKKG